MEYYIIDDQESHRIILKNHIEAILRSLHQDEPAFIEGVNGNIFLKKFMQADSQHKPALVFLDIHMPALDGLSALVRYREKEPHHPVYLVTSEDEVTISRLKEAHKGSQMSPAEKYTLLMRVVDRIKQGITEPGKISSVLEAISSLRMDPREVALKLGVTGFIHKPYERADIEKVIKKHIANA